jgi:hypothetical protein
MLVHADVETLQRILPKHELLTRPSLSQTLLSRLRARSEDSCGSTRNPRLLISY